MATDIIAITGHNLKPSEIIELPKAIDNWLELKTSYINDIRNKHGFDNNNEQIKEYIINKSKEKSYWDREIDENGLIDFWEHNESVPKTGEQYNTLNLHTFFGWLNIHRYTIRIFLFPEHKYGNFLYHEHCKFILLFNRVLAKRFGQNKVIYAADNGYESEEIENKAIEGEGFESLLEYGQNKFGISYTSIVERIKNMFFVDTNTDNIDYFEDLSWADIKNYRQHKRR